MIAKNDNSKKVKIRHGKLWCVFVLVILGCFSLTGCGNRDKETLTADIQGAQESLVKREFDPNKKSIVCTTFPLYDWMRNILGEHEEDYNLLLLLDNGMDLHSYQPTAEDMSRIAACDMFVYVGGLSDVWVEDALKEATNKDMQVINLMAVLGTSAKTEELVQGMQGEEDEDEPEYDEHVWLSLKNAVTFVNELSASIEKLDGENASYYRANADAYMEKLRALDERYGNIATASKTKTVLFGDRFPFRYLVDDYGLDYYAAFVGCSAETEASFETIAFLAGKVDELKLSYIFVIEGSDGKIAEAIINSSKEGSCEILTVNSLQSITAKDVDGGVTYLSVMEDNLKAFETALAN